MDPRDAFVQNLYNRTLNKKIVWIKSSGKGAVRTQVGKRIVEIVPVRYTQDDANDPAMYKLAVALSQLSRDKLKIIVYNKDGEVDIEISPSDLNYQLYADPNPKPSEIFGRMYESAITEQNLREENVLNELIRDLND